MEFIVEELNVYVSCLDARSGGLFLTPHSLCYFGLRSDDARPFVEARPCGVLYSLSDCQFGTTRAPFLPASLCLTALLKLPPDVQIRARASNDSPPVASPHVYPAHCYPVGHAYGLHTTRGQGTMHRSRYPGLVRCALRASSMSSSPPVQCR